MMKTNRYLIALVVALELILVGLGPTIVAVVLTPIRNNLRTDVHTIQWVITGYLIANVAVITWVAIWRTALAASGCSCSAFWSSRPAPASRRAAAG